MDVFDLLRCAVSLAAVFGALWWLHRRVTKGPRRDRVPGARLRSIEVVARQGLGAKAGVAVVDVDGQRYLLGVTEHAVNVLDRLGAAPAGSAPVVTAAVVEPAGPEGFAHALAAAERDEAAAAALPPRPVVRAVTAAVVVQRTAADGRESLAVLPAPAFPTRRAAREAAQALAAPSSPDPSFPDPSSAAPFPGAAVPVPESPEDEFERMLRAVAAGEAHPAPAPLPLPLRPAVRPDDAPARSTSPLAGSVLHPDTWRQTVAALRRLR